MDRYYKTNLKIKNIDNEVNIFYLYIDSEKMYFEYFLMTNHHLDEDKNLINPDNYEYSYLDYLENIYTIELDNKYIDFSNNIDNKIEYIYTLLFVLKYIKEKHSNILNTDLLYDEILEKFLKILNTYDYEYLKNKIESLLSKCIFNNNEYFEYRCITFKIYFIEYNSNKFIFIISNTTCDVILNNNNSFYKVNSQNKILDEFIIKNTKELSINTNDLYLIHCMMDNKFYYFKLSPDSCIMFYNKEDFFLELKSFFK